MSDVAIRVENLGKLYHIGGPQDRYKTIRDSIMDGVKAPFKRAGSLLRGQAHGAAQLDQTIWALKDVSFEVKQGEVVGIIGRNGAGKSTLLKILSRITEPTEGEVMLRGRVGSLLEVGTGFHPELTGRENVYLNGAILGMKREEIDRKFDEIVDFSGIERFIDTPVKHYSSGMYIRLAFSVAAHLEPEILLVDEVLSVGDSEFQRKCLGIMGDVASSGRTVLFVSHNMRAVRRLCTRATWLNEGRILQEGDTQDVVEAYINIATDQSKQTTRVWEDIESAPGNETIRLRKASVIPRGVEQEDLITLQTPLDFEFEIWNRVSGLPVNFSVHFFTLEGISVFAVSSDAEPRRAGIVAGRFTVPANYLNEGIYLVTLMVVKDRSRSLHTFRDILSFEVHEEERTGNWYGRWPGVVRPQFNFCVEEKIIDE